MKKNQLNLKIRPTFKQNDCWEYLKDNKTQFILFGGGAGGGKSWIGCEWLLLNCLMYPGTKWFIGRNELTRLKKSTYVTWLKVCKYHNIPKELWKLTGENVIEFINFKTKQFDGNGSKIDLLNVEWQPRDPLYERFGSSEYTGGWLEEVGEIKEKAYDILKSRIGRHRNDKYNLLPKMLMTCNPKKHWVYYEYYKPWKENRLPEDTCFIQSLYKDNPYTVKTYGMTLSKIKDKSLKQRLMHGNWEYESDDSNLMEYEKIIEMFSKEFSLDLNGEFYLSVDVARFGRDKAVLILWQGMFIKKVWYYDKSSCDFLVDKIKKHAEQYHIEYRNIIIDQDGVGGGVVDFLPGVFAFVNGSRPIEEFDDDKNFRLQETDRYSYKNLRSQCYFRLAEVVNEGGIGVYNEIPPDIKNWIIEELESIKRKDVESNEKKIQVIGKDEIKETLGRSPDFSDSLMMRMYYELGTSRDFEVGIVW